MDQSGSIWLHDTGDAEVYKQSGYYDISGYKVFDQSKLKDLDNFSNDWTQGGDTANATITGLKFSPLDTTDAKRDIVHTDLANVNLRTLANAQDGVLNIYHRNSHLAASDSTNNRFDSYEEEVIISL